MKHRWEPVLWGIIQWLAVAGVLATAWVFSGIVGALAVILPLIVFAASLVMTAREDS